MDALDIPGPSLLQCLSPPPPGGNEISQRDDSGQSQKFLVIKAPKYFYQKKVKELMKRKSDKN